MNHNNDMLISLQAFLEEFEFARPHYEDGFLEVYIRNVLNDSPNQTHDWGGYFDNILTNIKFDESSFVHNVSVSNDFISLLSDLKNVIIGYVSDDFKPIILIRVFYPNCEVGRDASFHTLGYDEDYSDWVVKHFDSYAVVRNKNP